MSAGYDVCVVKEGAWVVYAFFEESEEYDAVYTAKDIKNNYKEVCVLYAQDMAVIYHHSKTGSAKPKYLDVRANIKLAKEEKMRNLKRRKAPKPAPKPKPADPMPQPAPEIDELFPKKDQRKTAMLTLGVALVGTIITLIVPFALMNAEANTKILGMIGGLMLTGALSVVTYFLSEQSARNNNKKKMLESSDVWEDIKSSNFNTAGAPSTQTQNSKNTEEADINLPTTPQSAAQVPPKQQEGETTTEDGENWAPLPPVNLASGINLPSTEEVIENHEKFFSSNEEEAQSDQEISENMATINAMLTLMIDEGKNLGWDEEQDAMQTDLDFALTFYAAGALTKALEILKEDSNKLYTTLPLLFTRLNISPNETEETLIQLKEYLEYPQYMATYRHGENDALRYINANEHPTEIEQAFALWTDAETQEEDDFKTKFTAVLFTDIVSFTENTRTQGEGWVKDVIRAHNDIIRNILEKCNGVEIKHTGDGVLATFNSVNAACKAAHLFQKSVKHFNTAMPHREFHVRIGISAGEIIEMDNDIFGEAVNLAARLMQYCGGDEVIISETIKNIVEDLPEYTLKEVKDAALKGFENQSVYFLEQA